MIFKKFILSIVNFCRGSQLRDQLAQIAWRVLCERWYKKTLNV